MIKKIKLRTKKAYFVYIIVILFILLGINFISSQSCIITPTNNCDSSNIVLKLSETTNAHGELAGQNNYGYTLCCDFGNSVSSCNQEDKILGLSSQTNAHAERPESSNYNQNICYTGLSNCGFVNTSLAQGEVELLGISSETNAHIGYFDDYKSVTNNKRIVCNSEDSLAEICDLTTPTWTNSEGTTTPNANTNERVYSVVEGSDCSGANINISIFNKDTNEVVKSEIGSYGSSNANISWSAMEGTYQFRAKVQGETDWNITSGDLSVSDVSVCEVEPFSSGVSSCGELTNQEDCTNANQCFDWSNYPGLGDDFDAFSCGWENNECILVKDDSEPGLDYIVAQPEEVTKEIGRTKEFSVLAYYTDGSSNSVSPTFCVSNNEGVASKVSNTVCEFEAITVGSATITANYTESGITKTDTATFNSVAVGTNTTSHIEIIPLDKTIKINGDVIYTSILHWSNDNETDVTTATSFTSSDPGVATMSDNIATGVSEGYSDIIGEYGTYNYAASLQVQSDPIPYQLTDIVITPSSAKINEGLIFDEFDVWAYYTDESENRLIAPESIETCTSNNGNVAVRKGSSGCEFEAISIGTTTITVSYEESDILKTDTATLEVLSEGSLENSHIQLIPSERRILLEESLDYEMILHKSDTSTEDVTLLSGFTSSDPGVATMSDETATGVGEGFTEITGTYDIFESLAFLHVSGSTTPPEDNICKWRETVEGSCETDEFIRLTYELIDGYTESCSIKEPIEYICPAQIPLPFFNIFNLIAAMLLIVLVYWRMHVKDLEK